MESKQFFVKHWYRSEAHEIEHYVNGEPEKKSIVIAKIDKSKIVAALQNFADNLTELGQFVDLSSMENCPELLKGGCSDSCGR